MEWLLYWILKLDDIRKFFNWPLFYLIPSIVMAALTILIVVALICSNSGDSSKLKFSEGVLSRRKSIICAYIVCFFTMVSVNMIHTLIPSTKQLLAITTVGYTMEQIKSNPKILNTADKVYQLVDSKLTELLANVEVAKESKDKSKEL